MPMVHVQSHSVDCAHFVDLQPIMTLQFLLTVAQASYTNVETLEVSLRTESIQLWALVSLASTLSQKYTSCGKANQEADQRLESW